MQPLANDIENSLYMLLKSFLIKNGWCMQINAVHDGTVASNQVYVNTDLSAYNPSIVWCNGAVVGRILDDTLSVSYVGGRTIATVSSYTFSDTDLLRYGYYTDNSLPQYNWNGDYYDIDIVALNSLQKDIVGPGLPDNSSQISVPIIGLKSSEPLTQRKMGLGDLDRWQEFAISIVVIAINDVQRSMLADTIVYLLNDWSIPVIRWYKGFPPSSGDDYLSLGNGVFDNIRPVDTSVPTSDDWGEKWTTVVNCSLFVNREAGSGL